MSKKSIFHIFDLQVDMGAQQIFKNGAPLALTDLTAKLFFALFEKAPETVSVTELANTVWDREFVSEETMAQRVRLLRQALGDDAKSSKYIKTVRGVGYCLNSTPKRTPDRWLYRHKRVTITALATIFVAIAAWWINPSTTKRFSSPQPPQPATDVSALEADFLAKRARQYFSARRIEDIDIAIDLYEKALAKAPQNSSIKVGLSFSLSTRATKFDTVVGDDIRAEALARAALSTSDKNGAAWSALGYALDSQGKVAEATSAYLRAYALNPDDHSAASSAAYLLSIKGKLYEALKLDLSVFTDSAKPSYTDTQVARILDLLEYPVVAKNWQQKALLLHPQYPVVISEAIRSCLRAGDHIGAEALYANLGTTERTTPKIRRLYAYIHLVKGDLDTAISIFEKTEKKPPAIRLAALALRAKEQGMLPQDISFSEYTVMDATWPEGHVNAAYLFAVYGRNNEAIQSLVHAIDLGWRDSKMMQQLPFFDTLKNDPRYQAALNRIDRVIASERDLLNSDVALKKQLGIIE